jgi:hypothetical protein
VITAPRALQVSDRNRLASPQLASSAVRDVLDAVVAATVDRE